MKLFKLTLILLLSLIITNCSTDNVDDLEDEMATGGPVQDFIGNECFSILDELNFNINEGTDIPEVEGIFDISPAMALSSSNIIEEFNFNPEEEILDMTFAILDLQADGSSFTFSLNAFDQLITNALWIGNGNDFSVFFTIDLDIELFLIAISGTISQDGIQDGQFLICEVSDEEIGGVLLFDGDGLFEFNVD